MIPPTSTTIRSTGWRSVWVGRRGIGIGTLVLVAYTGLLFGAPWASAAATNAFAFVFGLALVVEIVVVEGSQLRWLALQGERARFGYLFGVIDVRRENLRHAPERSFGGGVRDVEYERVGATGLLSKRFIWVTQEQSTQLADWLALSPAEAH